MTKKLNEMKDYKDHSTVQEQNASETNKQHESRYFLKKDSERYRDNIFKSLQGLYLFMGLGTIVGFFDFNAPDATIWTKCAIVLNAVFVAYATIAAVTYMRNAIFLLKTWIIVTFTTNAFYIARGLLVEFAEGATTLMVISAIVSFSMLIIVFGETNDKNNYQYNKRKAFIWDWFVIFIVFVLPVAANVVQRHIDSVERAAELAKRLPKTEIMNKVKKEIAKVGKGRSVKTLTGEISCLGYDKTHNIILFKYDNLLCLSDRKFEDEMTRKAMELEFSRGKYKQCLAAIVEAKAPIYAISRFDKTGSLLSQVFSLEEIVKMLNKRLTEDQYNYEYIKLKVEMLNENCKGSGFDPFFNNKTMVLSAKMENDTITYTRAVNGAVIPEEKWAWDAYKKLYTSQEGKNKLAYEYVCDKNNEDFIMNIPRLSITIRFIDKSENEKYSVEIVLSPSDIAEAYARKVIDEVPDMEYRLSPAPDCEDDPYIG